MHRCRLGENPGSIKVNEVGASSRAGKLSACLIAETSPPTTDPLGSVSPVRSMTSISLVLAIGLSKLSEGL